MVIKKGDVFECIKDVVVDRSGRTLYFKGKFYTSITEGCITNEEKNEFYRWGIIDENFFRKLSDVEVAERKHPINENIGQLDDKLNPSHYSQYKIQPIDYIEQNGFNFLEGNVIKYVSRYKEKNGLEDLQKARVYLDRLINNYK